MSLPAITQLPQLDNLRIHGLIKSLASGMIVPIELAEPLQARQRILSPGDG